MEVLELESADTVKPSSSVAVYSVKPDRWLVSALKRLYFVSPTIFVAINAYTITAGTIQNIKTVNINVDGVYCQMDDRGYNEKYPAYAFCPYTFLTQFKALVGSWVGYAFLVAVCKFAYSFSLHTNDLRFLIANDMFSRTYLAYFIYYLGLAFTFATTAVGIYFTYASEHDATISQSSMISLASFTVGNCFALKELFAPNFQINPRRVKWSFDFPTPVYYSLPTFGHWSNAYGAFVADFVLMSTCMQAVIVTKLADRIRNADVLFSNQEEAIQLFVNAIRIIYDDGKQ